MKPILAGFQPSLQGQRRVWISLLSHTLSLHKLRLSLECHLPFCLPSELPLDNSTHKLPYCPSQLPKSFSLTHISAHVYTQPKFAVSIYITHNMGRGWIPVVDSQSMSSEWIKCIDLFHNIQSLTDLLYDRNKSMLLLFSLNTTHTRILGNILLIVVLL